MQALAHPPRRDHNGLNLYPRPKHFVFFCEACGAGYQKKYRKNKDIPLCELHLKSYLATKRFNK